MSGPSQPDNAAPDRAERIRRILQKCRARLVAGRDYPDEGVTAKFPELMPELGRELAKLRMIEAARRAAGQPESLSQAESVDDPPKAVSETASFQVSSDETGTRPADPPEVAPTPPLPFAPPARRKPRVRYFGDYELDEELGRGGMGVVYRARQMSLGRTVAVKMILAGQLASEQDVRRFHAEAEAAANLEHPGIVPIYEIGEHEDKHYFSMAFVEGRSLAEMIRERPLPSREAANYVKVLAEALAYAHAQGVLHRDIKPANVLVDQNGQPRLTDFGLAKRVGADSELTATGQVLGTPSYMSPEQAMGDHKSVGPSSDLYSLGALLYALLTGRPPFQADNPGTTIVQVTTQEPVPPRTLNPAIDRDLETICLKCLEKDPSRRYADCAAFSAELDRYLTGRPITARPISRPAKACRWCKRNPVVAGLMAAVAVVLVLGTISTSVMAVRANTEAHKAGVARDHAQDEQRRAEREKTRADQKAAAEQAARRDAEAALDRTERLLYCIRMQAAGRAWYVADISQVRSQLSACPPRLRDWEYDYMQALLTRPMTLRGHSDTVASVALSPDGKRIATGSWDKTVKIWDAATGQERRTLRGHSSFVFCVDFSPDGKRVASGSGGSDKTTRIWDVATGNELMTLRGHSKPVECIAFSPDGKRIATGSWDRTVKIWDATTSEERETLRGHLGCVFGVAFSPDGKRIATGSQDETLKTWDATTGKEILTLHGHLREVASVHFSPDGKRIVSGSWDNTVKIWDTATGEVKMTLRGHAGPVDSAAFSPDGEWIVSASSDNSVRVWDAATGEEDMTLRGHSGSVKSAVFSPDCTRIISVGADTVKMWDATRRVEAIPLRGHSSTVRDIAFSPDGDRIVSASQDKTLKIWQTATGQELMTLRGHSGGVWSVAFGPNGKRIASASEDETVRVWNAATGEEEMVLRGHSGWVRGVAFCPDGRKITSRGDDRTVKVWNAATGKATLTLRGHSFGVWSVGFSPDGRRIASGSVDSADAKIWDAATGKQLMSLHGHSGSVSCIVFSPDGERIVTASSDNSIRVWNAATGDEDMTLRGHSGHVHSVAFSPDGNRIVSGSVDGTVKIWDAVTGEQTLTLHEASSKNVWSVAFSPDGRRIAGASGYKTLQIWDSTLPRLAAAETSEQCE